MSKLAQAIEDAGFSRSDFAAIIGIQYNNLHKYIDDKSKIKKMRVRIALRMSCALGITMEELLAMSEE